MIFLLVAFMAAPSSTLVADEVYIINKGSKLYLDGYTSHHWFAEALDTFLGDRIVRSVECELSSLDVKADDLLANIDSRQYLIIQLIHALSSQDLLYSGLILQTCSSLLKPEDKIDKEVVDTKLVYSTEKIYLAAQFMIQNVNKGFIQVTNKTAEVLLWFFRKHNVFDRACSKGDAETVKWLVKNDKSIRKFGIESVLTAWNNSHWETVKSLMKGGDISGWSLGKYEAIMRNKDGMSLLHFASEIGRTDIARTLIELGAELNALDFKGRSPVQLAMEGGHQELVRLFLKNNVSTEGLIGIAVAKDDFQMVKELVTHGVDINAKDKMGRTPLHVAEVKSLLSILLEDSLHGFKIFESLCQNEIESFADILCKFMFMQDQGAHENDREMSLKARPINRTSIINYLIQKGGKPLMNNNTLAILLTAAIEAGNENAALFFLDTGANPNLELFYKNKTENINERNQKPKSKESCFKIKQLESFEKKFNTTLTMYEVKAPPLRKGWTLLHGASAMGLSKLVESLVQKGADVNIKAISNTTPLHAAAHYGHLPIVKILLKRGAELNIVTIKGESPLYMACNRGHLDIVKFLSEKGGELNCTSSEGHTLLHSAAAGGHKDVVNFLIDLGLNIDAKCIYGWTPLLLASYYGHIDVTKELLTKGADKRARTKSGWSALHLATSQNNIELMKLLINKGMNVNTMDSRYQTTPLHVASYLGLVDMVKAIIEILPDINAKINIGEYAPLHLASGKGHFPIVKVLLENDANPNLMSSDNHTSLITACRCGYKDIVQILLDHRADLYAMSTTGWSAFHAAAYAGREDIVKMLLEKHVDPNIWNLFINKYQTPLFKASESGNVAVVKLLIKKGADIFMADKDGRFPIHSAVRKGRLEVVEYFLENGVDPNVKDREGTSLLRFACKEGRAEVVGLLAGRGVDVNQHGGELNMTTLHQAAALGHHDVVRVLLQHGAQVNSQEEAKETPLDYAEWCGHGQLAEYIIQHGGIRS